MRINKQWRWLWARDFGVMGTYVVGVDFATWGYGIKVDVRSVNWWVGLGPVSIVFWGEDA